MVIVRSDHVMSTCISSSARYLDDPILELVYNDMSVLSQLSPMDIENELAVASISDLVPASLQTQPCDNESISAVQSSTSDLSPSKESTSTSVLKNLLEFPHFMSVSDVPRDKQDKRGPKLACVQVCKNTKEACNRGCFEIPFCGKHKNTVQAREYIQLYGRSAYPSVPVDVLIDTPTEPLRIVQCEKKVTGPLMVKTIAEAQIKAKQFGIKSKKFGRNPCKTLTNPPSDITNPPPSDISNPPPSSTNIINSKPQSSDAQTSALSPRPRVLGNKPSVTCPSVSVVERDSKILSWYMGTKDIKTIDFRYMWEGYKYLVILEHKKSHSVTTLTRDGFLNITLPKSFKFTPNRKGQMKYVRSYKHVLLDGLYERRLRWVFNTRKSEVPVRGGTSV